MRNHSDTIAAIATPIGRGGIGIIRISGNLVTNIAQTILHKSCRPRYAEFTKFFALDGSVIDHGLALFFPGPNSFTGEDILELQGHGGPLVLSLLLETILACGARVAQPGEFSERAFLNDKIDLAQAEAIADLIDSTTKQAAQAALHSLQGDFSKQIQHFIEQLIQLRMYVEAAIDFPEEEIDFLSDGKISHSLHVISEQLQNTLNIAQQGKLLREGISVVIMGKPNAGKSSLLNQLAKNEVAIVTDIPGTTRDILREFIHIEGMPVHIIDTAGLRESEDRIEQEGIRRAMQESAKADHILWLADATEVSDIKQWLSQNKSELQQLPNDKPITIILNKIDLLEQSVEKFLVEQFNIIKLSAKTGDGVELLQQHLKASVGYKDEFEGSFLARKRHIEALTLALTYLKNAAVQLQEFKAGELVAEELLQAQTALEEITGKFSSDDLLGKIFSSFCIGK